MNQLDDAALNRAAAIFKVLAEPRRLKLLNALRAGERRVSDLVTQTGSSQANVSKHLSLMSNVGIVLREQRGNCAYYRIADPATYQLCDIVCDQLLSNALAQLAAHGKGRA